MVDTKSSYEFMLVVSVKLGEKTAELIEKFKGLIENNAEFKGMDDWGKKKLAYPINKEKEGQYVLFTFDSKPEFPKELDRICNITDGVLRSMIIKKA